MSLAALTQVQSVAEMVAIHCGKCGGIYAIAERYRQRKSEHGGYWNCPYCQCSWGYGQSEVQRLKKELEEKQREVDNECKRKEWAQQEAKIAERRRRALKGHLTKTKKRVGHGVCPCCQRSFENLRRHMATQHPAYHNTR